MARCASRGPAWPVQGVRLHWGCGLTSPEFTGCVSCPLGEVGLAVHSPGVLLSPTVASGRPLRTFQPSFIYML